MVVTIDGKKFSLVPVNDDEDANRTPTPAEVTNQLLAIPTPVAPKPRQIGGA